MIRFASILLVSFRLYFRSPFVFVLGFLTALVDLLLSPLLVTPHLLMTVTTAAIMATRFNYVYGDNCALGKLFTWIAVAIFSAIYTGWIITYIPQVIDASSILQAWEVRQLLHFQAILHKRL